MPPQSEADPGTPRVIAGVQLRGQGSLLILHAAFAMTGVLHAIGGALLPSISASFGLSDSQAGSLALAYFAGTASGALFCTAQYERLMRIGFLLVTLGCVGVVFAPRPMLLPVFFLLGVGVGIPMTAVSMIAGRRFGDRSAAPLTLLNFSWSAGALLAPLIAARILIHHSFRGAYLVLAAAAAVAALLCCLLAAEPAVSRRPESAFAARSPLAWIALFSMLTFLQVGIENTAATWLATFTLRSSGAGAAAAAATSSLYWFGFLTSRGFSAALLMRVAPMRLLRFALVAAAVAALLLITSSSPAANRSAMFVLGAALAPIFPLLLAAFFAGSRTAADSRWVLAICGFGGSVMPWLTGSLSSRTQSLRVGMATVPVEILLLLCLLPIAGTLRLSARHAS